MIRLFRNVILLNKKKKVEILPDYPTPGIANFFKVTPSAELGFKKVAYVNRYTTDKFTVQASAVVVLTKN